MAESDHMKAMSLIWANALGLAHVGEDDDFFELGGDSYAATIVMIMIEERFGIVADASVLFEFSTLRSFADQVRSIQARTCSSDDVEGVL